MNLPVSPHASSIERLKQLIDAVEELRSIHDRARDGDVSPEHLFSTAMWVKRNPGKNDSLVLSNFRRFLSAHGAPACDKLVLLVEALIADDDHLRACCPDPVLLARAIETLGEEIRPLTAPNWRGPAAQDVALLLAGIIFMVPFQRRYYLHFYNLELEGTIDLGDGGVLANVAHDFIPSVTGEFTPFSTLHDPHTGVAFMTLDMSTKLDMSDAKAWELAWNTAFILLQALKYFKYGIVDMDYGGVVFQPPWLNSLRRTGISIGGMPRRDTQTAKYKIQASEVSEVKKWWGAVKQWTNGERAGDASSELRSMIGLAGTYYENHHKRVLQDEQLIDLVIALEVMFSPRGSQGEHRFRIAQRAALLLGKDATERGVICGFLRRAYDARSKLVHSGMRPFEGKPPFTPTHLEQLGNYIRESILRFAALYRGGWKTKNDVMDDLDKCAYDAGLATKLFADSQVETALTRFLATDCPRPITE